MPVVVVGGVCVQNLNGAQPFHLHSIEWCRRLLKRAAKQSACCVLLACSCEGLRTTHISAGVVLACSPSTANSGQCKGFNGCTLPALLRQEPQHAVLDLADHPECCADSSKGRDMVGDLTACSMQYSKSSCPPFCCQEDDPNRKAVIGVRGPYPESKAHILAAARDAANTLLKQPLALLAHHPAADAPWDDDSDREAVVWRQGLPIVHVGH